MNLTTCLYTSTIVLTLFLLLNAVHAQQPKRPDLTPGNIARALAETRATAREDPLRPGYHLVPPAGFLGDPDAGIFHDGWHHLFYMHRPFSGEGGPWYWGHERSRDLVHWEFLPPNLVPPRELGVQSMMSGGSIVAPDGRPMVFYSAGHEGQVKQWRAIGNKDLTEWSHDAPNPVLTLDHEGVPEFHTSWRDPFLFRHEGRTFMILFAERIEEDVVHLPLFEAKDKALGEWEYRGILYSEKKRKVRNLEVPNFHRIGNKWVLLISCGAHIDGTRWYVGDLDGEKLTFTPTSEGVLDHSSHFYAQQTIPGKDDGELYVIGWFPGWDREWMPDFREDLRKNTGTWWNGCFALPRRVTIGEDGQLLQTPVSGLKALRKNEVRWDAPRELPVKNIMVNYDVLEEVRGDQLEIQIELELGNSAFCGLNVLAGEDGNGGCPIMWSGDLIQVDGIQVPLLEWNEGDPVKLQIFVDRAYVEVFVNDGLHTVSRKIKAENIAGDRVAFTRIGGAMTVRNFQAWQLKTLNAPKRPK